MEKIKIILHKHRNAVWPLIYPYTLGLLHKNMYEGVVFSCCKKYRVSTYMYLAQKPFLIIWVFFYIHIIFWTDKLINCCGCFV